MKPDYVKPKYGKKAKLYYVDTDSFKVYIKTEDFYLDVAKDIETWFDIRFELWIRKTISGWEKKQLDYWKMN